MEFANKAVIVKKYGGYDVLSVDKFPLPVLEKYVEVKVNFCGMNFADLYTRQGLITNKKTPFVLGMECAGVVSAVVGDDIGIQVNQRVICYDYNGGMYQDVVRVSPEHCFLLPDHVTLEQGAAIFVNYLTAYFSIFELGNLKANEKILIQSCAGGVGWAATQLAKTVEGVEIIGTTSQEKFDAVKENGVKDVFVYENLEKDLKEACPDGVDLIIDNQAGKTFLTLQEHLRPLGRIILIGANHLIKNEQKLSTLSMLKAWWNMKSVSPEILVRNNRVIAGLHLGTLIEKDRKRVTEALHAIFSLLKEGKIQPKIDSVWKIDQIVDATKVLAQRQNVGKVLLTLEEDKKAEEEAEEPKKEEKEEEKAEEKKEE
ncbi:synaptic vesicle membrane protein VAT-1 homolog [Agrilus planipennis]|uniref:Synaptic vesicle membrane protein VAT-1 homolog n=1 Tax=Agrilus planipennis TaxID=224129 RepID=A0A1W4X296_AGRPL|nr:synaptic vesicle membrane protein VAT-1 homolog [Agrilus planipennis]